MSRKVSGARVGMNKGGEPARKYIIKNKIIVRAINKHTLTLIHSHTHPHTNANTHTHTPTRPHTRPHTHIHIHIYTHTPYYSMDWYWISLLEYSPGAWL